MFEAAEEGYAGDPGPRSLRFSNPGVYGLVFDVRSIF
jgi:hypothetical protein